MTLPEVARAVSPAVVAFGSRIANSKNPEAPGFPPIIGTGFFVDKRGLVMTNEHVIEAWSNIPANARIVMIFPPPTNENAQTRFGVVLRSVLAINSIASFASGGPFYGVDKPDFAFVHVDIKDVPFLEICGDSDTLEMGVDVLTIGFPKGNVPLMPYSPTKASQVSPFARRGIISSVLPCPCPDPHGFTVDILSEGGASGSPIVRSDDPRVIGILHAGFGGAPITYGIPGHLMQLGLEMVTDEWNPDLSAVPTLDEVIAAERSTQGFNWTTLKIPASPSIE
jgi:S1-C subfamily serine protease